jgi:hypothetical protein
LRRLPTDLSRGQVLFTDALRLSGQIATWSLQKLEQLLIALMSRPDGDALGDEAVEGIALAYGVIDAAIDFAKS